MRLRMASQLSGASAPLGGLFLVATLRVLPMAAKPMDVPLLLLVQPPGPAQIGVPLGSLATGVPHPWPPLLQSKVTLILRLLLWLVYSHLGNLVAPALELSDRGIPYTLVPPLLFLEKDGEGST